MNGNKSDVAKANFLSGLNCAQAVVLAFKDEINVDENVLKSLVTGLGAGLGRQRLTCGAVSGMAVVLSALNSNLSKAENYALIQKACAEFKSDVGSLICGELLKNSAYSSPVPEKRTDEYYKKRPCADLCALAAEIAEKYCFTSD